MPRRDFCLNSFGKYLGENAALTLFRGSTALLGSRFEKQMFGDEVFFCKLTGLDGLAVCEGKLDVLCFSLKLVVTHYTLA